MTDEARDISINVRATQAIRDLTRVGVAIDSLGGAVGKTDPQLQQLDRQLLKVPDTVARAARTIAQLKQELNGLSKELTQSARESSVLERKLVNTTNKLNQQKEIVQTQKGLIQAFIKDNLRLADSYDKVSSAAGRSGAAQSSGPKIGTLASAPLVQTQHGYFANGAVPLTEIAKASNAATKGIDGTTRAVSDLNRNVQQNALRYQLYDVAATMGIVGATALKSGLAVTAAGIEWDKNFANVVRTSQVTGTAVNWLKDQFLDLQTAIPVSSQDLATIATLGAQMGVAASNLTNFTGVTAKFSATAGVSVEDSATALSRLNQLLPDVEGNYSRLASTILRTGVNSVATEAQIVAGTSQIASMGQIAGLTTPEVVALSSAMSSLGMSPELQRSVITSSFSRMMTATSEVTAKTEKFGAVLNMTGKEFQAAWRSDALGTYEKFLQAVASRGDAVTILQDLSLASQRLTPNLLKLGQNTEVLDKALSDTTDEWGKNGELTRQYGIISNTVSAKIQVLGQTWEALLVTLDDSDVVIGPLIDGLTGILQWLRQIASAPGVSALASVGSAVVALTGITALGAAGLAGMAAGYIAITNAAAGLTALTHGNSAALGINSLAQVENNAVRGAGAGITDIGTLAISRNTAAMGYNSVATTGAGSSLLKMSGGVIRALPSILKWTGIIGLATAAVTALISAAATSPDWSLDLQKNIAGVKTPHQTIKFDTSRLKEVKANNAALLKEQARFGKMWDTLNDQNPLDISKSKYIKEQTKILHATDIPVWKDLEEALMNVKDPTSQLQELNNVSKITGMSVADLLKKLPGLSSVLGDNAAAAAAAVEETDKLEAAQSLWASSLGALSPSIEKQDEAIASLIKNVQTGAGSFLDFSDSLKSAYEVDKKSGAVIGGGLSAFLSGMNNQVAGFEDFYGNLGALIQKGGVQLASFFAEQGPQAAQALTDSLKMTPDQISQIEQQMSLAQFYKSPDFANIFAQNNALLAQAYRAGGPAAAAEVSKALSATLKGAAPDPAVLAELAKKWGFKIDVSMIPDLNEDQFSTARALLDASIQPIKIPVTTNVGMGDFTVTRQIDAWIVEMDGHSITMEVDPNTDRGRAIIAQWRDNEYQVPLELQATANTTSAKSVLDAFINGYVSRSYYINFRATLSDLNGPASGSGRPGVATGGLYYNGQLSRSNYPKYANGTIFRGPGSGTSDSILARVSNGEAITRARAVRYYGTRMMEDINHMRFPRYATGMTPGGFSGSSEARQIINATVVQNYPTTRNPIKALKQDAESVIAGIWA